MYPGIGVFLLIAIYIHVYIHKHDNNRFLVRQINTYNSFLASEHRINTIYTLQRLNCEIDFLNRKTSNRVASTIDVLSINPDTVPVKTRHSTITTSKKENKTKQTQKEKIKST